MSVSLISANPGLRACANPRFSADGRNFSSSTWVLTFPLNSQNYLMAGQYSASVTQDMQLIQLAVPYTLEVPYSQGTDSLSALGTVTI